jgi:hypothetical protein
MFNRGSSLLFEEAMDESTECPVFETRILCFEQCDIHPHAVEK